MAHEYSPEVLYRTVELVLQQGKQKLTAKQIADQVNTDFKAPKLLNRQTVYRAVAQACALGIVKLVPPPNEELTTALRKRFPSSDQLITVISTDGAPGGEKVSFAAAELVMQLVRDLGKVRPSRTVGIGLGPGRATLDFCQHFGELLESQAQCPKLRMVSISAGCPARLPEYASSGFFSLLKKSDLLEEKIGLFAESLIRVKDFKRVRQTPGVHEAFEAKAKRQIDIVVTSMGDFSDEHDLLRLFLSDAGMDPAEIERRGWIGNVQYRPYTKSGPAAEARNDHRAVTVFELEDLASMSREKNKFVVLMARQCGKCGTTRARALMPLLTNPTLAVFSHLLVDSSTARALLNMPLPEPPPGNS